MGVEKSDHYDDLLKFISSFDEWESFTSFYNGVSSFFYDKLGGKKAIILSLPTTLEKARESSFRVLHSYDELSDFSVLETLEKEKEKLLDIKEGDWLSFKKNKLNLLKLGSFNQQNIYFGYHDNSEMLEKELKEFVGGFLNKGFSHVKKWTALQHTKNLIHVDDVTGLFNQRRMMIDLDEAIIRYEKSNEIFSVLFIDIDHFKRVNDGHGHIMGTQLLADVGDTLKSNMRSNDYLYRYGGDEFVMLLPRVDHDLAHKIGERLLNTIKTKDFDFGEQGTGHISVSIGIAVFPEDADSRDEILSFADRMMYHAKAIGRGKVCRAKDVLNVAPFPVSSKKAKSE